MTVLPDIVKSAQRAELGLWTHLDNFLSSLAANAEIAGRGLGSFAIAPIARATVVATFGGSAANRAALASFEADRISRSIQVDSDLFFVGPQRREPGDSINHSCEPNCALRNATQVITIRDIAVGEELTFDYSMSDTSNYDEFECSCGSALCRDVVRGDDWRRADLQERYAGYFSPYIARKIAAISLACELSKRDVERMLGEYDHDPAAALLVAMRIVIGAPFASWPTAVTEYCTDTIQLQQLLNFDRNALDSLATELNETRGIKL